MKYVFFFVLALLTFTGGLVVASDVSQVDALKGSGKCKKVADCRFAGLGHRACGGPREYVIYSIVDANENELLKLLAKISSSERQMQKKAGLAGACLVAPEPLLGCVENVCVDTRKESFGL